MNNRNETAPATDARLHSDMLTSGAITTVGFGLCRAWIILCLSAGIAGGGTPPINWDFLAIGSVAAFACAAIDKCGFSAPSKRRGFSLATITCVSASCAFMIAALFSQSDFLMTCGLALGGIGAALLQIAWGTCFARHQSHFALVCTPAAAIVTGTTLAIVSSDLSAFVLAVMPFASLCLLALETMREFGTLTPALDHKENEKTENDETQEALDKTADAPIARLMLSIAAFAFLVRIFDAIPVTGADPLVALGGSATFSLVIVGVLFIVIVQMVRRKHVDILPVYRLSLPLMAFGLAIVALFYEQHAAISIALVCIGYELFDLLSWVLFSRITRRTARSPYRSFGIGVGCTFAGMACGYALGQSAIAPAIQNGSMDTSGIAVIAIVFLVITAFLVLPESTLAKLTQRKAKTPPRTSKRPANPLSKTLAAA